MSRTPKDRTAAKQHAPPITDNPASAGANTIVDNRNRRVGDFLHDNIHAGSDLSIVSAYFTIYAYEALRDVLEEAGRMRFLYGDPTATGTPDPSGDGSKLFRLNEDGGMELQQALAQKPLARSCAAWIRQQVDIRTISPYQLPARQALSYLRTIPSPQPSQVVQTSRSAGSALAPRPMSNLTWSFAIKKIDQRCSAGLMNCGTTKV